MNQNGKMRCGQGLRMALAAVSLALGLAACGPGPRADVLTIGSAFEFTSLDPVTDGSVFAAMQVIETLVDIDSSGMPAACLASAWSVDESGRVWRFALRAGVRFHDGSVLDAAAARRSLELASAQPGVLRNARIQSISSEGPLDLVVTLRAPYSPLLATLAHASAAILAPAAYEADGKVSRLIGTGPYRIERVSPPHKLDVVRHEAYWGSAAHIERASYLTGHRPESRALQAQSGQVDLVYTLDPAGADQLRGSGAVTVHSVRVPRTLLLKVNAAHPALASREVRQALSLALDREGIANAIVRVPGSAANQLLPPFLSSWHNGSLAPARRDLDRARELLDASGWQRGPDGLVRKDGAPMRLRLVTYADRPELVVIATAVQDQLREVGVTVDVSVENSSAIPAGHADNTLELALVARNYANVADPLGVLLGDFAAPRGGDWGAMNWSNEELSGILERLKGETDEQRYAQLGQRVTEILAEELPVIPLTFYTQQVAVSARVRDFAFDPFERSFQISRMSFVSP